MPVNVNEIEPDEKIVEIEMERLREFRNHPFKVKADAQMLQLIESISKYGILNPLIVRPLPEGVYEIIAGHRRKYAAQHLGFRKMPVIIRVLKDDDAVINMVDSNLFRETIRPSEKAFAYKMKYEAIKRKEIESWVSEEKPHYIEKLPVGDYTLREVTAPDGYLKAEDVKFTVKDTGEIQKVVMKDDYTKVEISKQDITNSKELLGAKLTIFDKDGKEVESWVSGEKPHYIEKLPAGEYTLREVTAPDGYEVAEDVKFKVEETGEIQHVVMKDAPKKQLETTPTTEKPTTPDNPTNPTTPSTETPKKETLTTPKTGDDRNPLIWLLLFGIGGCMAGAAWYLRKKDEKDQNLD